MCKQEIPVVVLAAGESKRFGSPKQLANWQNIPMLQNVLNNIQACGLEAYVALGAHFEEITGHPHVSISNNKIIKVVAWQSGLSQTIRESVRFFEHQSIKGIIFLLGDQPLLDKRYLKRFFEAIRNDSSEMLATVYSDNENNIGVPAYFPSSTFNQLSYLKGDQGAKSLLAQNAGRKLSCQQPLVDVDEPSDLGFALRLSDSNCEK